MLKTKQQLDAEKLLAAQAAATNQWVRSGMTLGLGTGSTAEHFIRALGNRVRTEGLKISGVPTSRRTEDLARAEGITILEPARGLRLDLTIDGADEIGPNLSLIKGGGAALTREKIVACASRQMLVISDSSKLVKTLGRFPLPVEVIPFAAPWIMDEIEKLGGSPRLRVDASANPVITDQGNHIIDCPFGEIAIPAELAHRLQQITGIVEHGLFLSIATAALIGDGQTVRKVDRRTEPPTS